MRNKAYRIHQASRIKAKAMRVLWHYAQNDATAFYSEDPKTLHRMISTGNRPGKCTCEHCRPPKYREEPKAKDLISLISID